jgi:hypothetical protein
LDSNIAHRTSDFEFFSKLLERSRRANWKHGYYSREAKVEASRARAAILALRYLRMLGH